MMIISLAVKGLLILAATSLVVATMRKRSPAERFSVWAFAFAGLVLLPLLAYALPTWTVITYPNSLVAVRSVDETETDSTRRTKQILASSQKNRLVADQNSVGQNRHHSSAIPNEHSDELVHSSNNELENTQAFVIQPPLNATAPSVQPDPKFESLWRWLPDLLNSFWAIGFLAIIFRLVASAIMLRRMENRCESFWCDARKANSAENLPSLSQDQSRIAQTAVQIAREMNLKRPFGLVFRDSDSTPFVWGELKHRVVLPSSVIVWSDSKVRSVLAHELAHIQRNDPATHLLVQLSVALHWLNPFVWLAARQMNHERELACDDRVLCFGIRPNVYAKHLWEVSFKSNWSGAIAMSRRSGLTRRMQRILESNIDRRVSTLTYSFIGLLVMASISLPVSMAKMMPTATQEAQTKSTSQDDFVKVGKELFYGWWSRRRLPDSDNIPWGLVKLLGDDINDWVNDEATQSKLDDADLENLKTLSAMTKRTNDWTPSEAKAFAIQVSQLSTEPVETATRKIKSLDRNIFYPGLVHRNNGPANGLIWSEPATNGLRIGIAMDDADATTKYFPGTPWRRLLWLHNTSDKTLLISTPYMIPFESLNVSAEDADGNQLPIVKADVSNVAEDQRASSQNRRLAPNEKCTLSMEPIWLGKPSTLSAALGKGTQRHFVDVSKATKIKLKIRPELKIGNNPLVQGPSFSVKSRNEFYKTFVHQLMPPDGEQPKLAAKTLSLAAGGIGSDPGFEAIDASIKKEAFDQTISALANLNPTKPVVGKLSEIEFELAVEPISQSEGEQELERLFAELFEWDRDRRARIVAAKEADEKEKMMAVLDEEIPYPRFARMMQLAEAWPQSETAMEASLLTMKTTYRFERDTAMKVLINHHATSSRISEALPFTGYTSQRSEWATQILDVNDSPMVVAHAMWEKGPAWSSNHAPEPEDAIEFYRGIIRDFGDMKKHRGYWGVPQPRKTFGELALRKISQIQAKAKWKVGSRLPAFEGVDVSGKPISLADYQGKTTLIVYWATWCGPCLHMAEMEKRMLKRYADKPFDILGVCGDFTIDDLDDNEKSEARVQSVQETAAKHGLSWRSVRNCLDNGDLVSELLGFPSLPYTILIDGDGIVRSTNFINGTTTDPVSQEKYMMSEIEKVLGGKFETDPQLAKLERQNHAINAYRRIQFRLTEIETSVNAGEFKQAEKQIRTVMNDDSAPVLHPFMLNRVNWTLYLTHQKKPLPKELLAILLESSELAAKNHPTDPYLLGTLAHIVHANGDLNRAIKVLEKGIKHADEDSLEHLQKALKKLRLQQSDRE